MYDDSARTILLMNRRYRWRSCKTILYWGVPNHIGRYVDLGILGEGGMGEVRKVRDEILNRNLAMKIVHPSMLLNSKALTRFLKRHRLEPNFNTPTSFPFMSLVNFQTADSISP